MAKPSDEARAVTEKQQRMLDALARCSGGSEWMEADTVAKNDRRHLGLDAFDDELIEAPAAGRILSRLADEGRCEKRDDGYMNRYRSASRRR